MLSEKLAKYANALLATQLQKKPPSATTGEVGKRASELLEEDEREVKLTIFALKDDDFPLVCSFGQFMKILENTVK